MTDTSSTSLGEAVARAAPAPIASRIRGLSDRSMAWLFITIVYQLLVARRILAIGYTTVWSAEVPIAPQLMSYKLRTGSDPRSVKHMIGDQYAQAYLTRRTLSKQVSASLDAETRRLVRSLLVGLVVAMAAAVAVSVVADRGSAANVATPAGK